LIAIEKAGRAMQTPIHEIANVEALLEGPPARRLVNLVLLLAIKDKASEVRFQPTEGACKLSYEVDGKLLDLVPAPTHFLAKRIINVIKVMADLDFATQDRQKERCIQLKIGNRLETAQVIIQRAEKYEEAILRFVHPIQASEEAVILAEEFSQRWPLRGKLLND
jgi:type IV pilus assembly protein PilB